MANGHILNWAEGNFGALNFLEQVIHMDTDKMNKIISSLTSMHSIRGTNLWVLYSDLCNKDLDKVLKLIENCPPSLLENACSRQDYSGREIVKNFLN